MAKVDLNRLKGNFAEHVTAAWLSRVCLVRPVAEGTDIGLDLYCESVLESTPYLHFWVQVKAIPESNILDEGGKKGAFFDFPADQLRYWERQPIPVYVFLVPIGTWPPVFPATIYTIRVTEQIIRAGIPEQKSVRLKTFEGSDASNLDEDLREFVEKIVPSDSSILFLRKGMVVPWENLDEDQEPRYTIGIGFQYVEKILDAIRDTATWGLLQALTVERVDPKKKIVRKRFENILSVFKDDLHNWGISMLVRSAHFDGDIDKAKGIIKEQTEIVNSSALITAEEKQKRLNSLNILLSELH